MIGKVLPSKADVLRNQEEAFMKHRFAPTIEEYNGAYNKMFLEMCKRTLDEFEKENIVLERLREKKEEKRKIRKEIFLMVIPFIGIWFVIKRIIPDPFGPLTWWVYDDRAIWIEIGLFFYQIGIFILWKFILVNYL